MYRISFKRESEGLSVNDIISLKEIMAELYQTKGTLIHFLSGINEQDLTASYSIVFEKVLLGLSSNDIKKLGNHLFKYGSSKLYLEYSRSIMNDPYIIHE